MTAINFNPFSNFELYIPVEAALQSQLEEIEAISQNNEWYAKWGGRFVSVAYPTAIILLITWIALPVLSTSPYIIGLVISLASTAFTIQHDLNNKNKDLIATKSSYVYMAAKKMMENVNPFGEEGKISFSEAKERSTKIQQITEAAYQALNPLLQKSSPETTQQVMGWKMKQDTLVQNLSEKNLNITLSNSVAVLQTLTKFIGAGKDPAQLHLLYTVKMAQSYYTAIFAKALIS